MDGMYSRMWTSLQWSSRRTSPRKPEEGGVGRRGTGVMLCNHRHNDHREAGNMKMAFIVLYRRVERGKVTGMLHPFQTP